MRKTRLFNGESFPEFIFTNKVKSYLFFEFDFVFTEEFWLILKKLLEKSGVQKIFVENLQPAYHFNEEVDVASLPGSFIKIAQEANLEGYFSFNASLHMITEKALIYSHQDEEAFCILLDRAYSIAIMGLSNSIETDFLSEFTIKDMPDYLTLAFAGKNLPNSFKKSFHENWGAASK